MKTAFNNLKRIIITGLLASTLVLGLIIPAQAASLNPVADKGGVEKGESINVTVSLSEALTDITSMEARLYYDSTLFDFDYGGSSVTDTKAVIVEQPQVEKSTGKSYIMVNYLDTTAHGNLSAGAFYTLKFTAKTEVENDTASVFKSEIRSRLMIDGKATGDTAVTTSVTVYPEPVEGYTLGIGCDKTEDYVGNTALIKLTPGNVNAETEDYNSAKIVLSYDSSKLQFNENKSTIPASYTIDDNNGVLTVNISGSMKLLTKQFVLAFNIYNKGDANIKVASAQIDKCTTHVSEHAPQAVLTSDEVSIHCRMVIDPEQVTAYEYVKLPNSNNMYLVLADATPESGKTYAYEGNKMFWSEKYGTYAYVAISDKSIAEFSNMLYTKVGYVDGSKLTLSYEGDVNKTGDVEINDVQLIWNMYNAKYSDFSKADAEKFLRADINGDKKINMLDAAALMNKIK